MVVSKISTTWYIHQRLKARRDFMWKKHHKHVIRPFGKIDIGATPLHFFPKTSLNLEFWKVKIFSLWHLHVWFSFWRTWQHKWTKPSNKMQIKKGVLCHLSKLALLLYVFNVQRVTLREVMNTSGSTNQLVLILDSCFPIKRHYLVT